MSAFEIREAIPADAEAVADYHDRCFRTTYSSQLLAVSGHQLVHLFVEPSHQHVGLGSHLLALGGARDQL